MGIAQRKAENTNNGTDGDECDYCFESDTGNAPVEFGIVAAICDVNQYLTNAYEYMTTRRLVYEHAIAQK